MHQNTLKKFLIILISASSVILVYNKIICGEILFPKDNTIFTKNRIHIVGKLTKRCNLIVDVNNREIDINSASLIKIKTNDGIFYLFKVDIKLDNGTNILKVTGSDINSRISVKYMKFFFNDVNKPKKFFFHMNDNKIFCKTCHNFSSSKECGICHSDKNRGKYVHGPVATWQCFICHDKNNYFAIKQPLSVQCLKCHQEFADAMYKAKFAHAPSVAGYCTSCHLPHIANEKYFLSEKVNKLCCRCHESKKTGYHVIRKKVKGHIDIFCTKCHNPHYGETKFLFLKKINSKRKLCKRCHK